MHFSAGSREEAASWVIQSAHSEAHTETHEPEREMKVEPEKLESEGEDGDETETDEGKEVLQQDELLNQQQT